MFAPANCKTVLGQTITNDELQIIGNVYTSFDSLPM